MASDCTWAALRRRLAAGREPAHGRDAGPLWLEGYGPDGAVILIACRTADPAQTRAAVRDLFSGHGAHLGAPGSIAYLFKQAGVLCYPEGSHGVAGGDERLAQLAYAAGAEDVVQTPEGLIEVLTVPGEEDRVGVHIERHGGGTPAGTGVLWRTQARVPLAGAHAREMLRLLTGLARRDDVESVYTNAQIPDEIVAEL